jgi:hypothetical protein
MANTHGDRLSGDERREPHSGGLLKMVMIFITIVDSGRQNAAAPDHLAAGSIDPRNTLEFRELRGSWVSKR